jgi:hypothetical protein
MKPNPCLSCNRREKDKNNPVCKDCAKRVEYINQLDLELNYIHSYSEIQPSPCPANIFKGALHPYFT